MSRVVEVDVAGWTTPASAAKQTLARQALEQGSVLLLPRLRFEVEPGEGSLFTPATLSGGKNVSFDAADGDLRNCSLADAEVARLTRFMLRFADQSRGLIEALLPAYGAGLVRKRTSFRPAEIAGRVSSWREDDSQLHVDSFQTSPVQGWRILRVFSNVDPQGRGRRWRLGEPFERVAARFVPSIRRPLPALSFALHRLGRTKTRRSAYDHYMLQLHDGMKADAAYQASADQESFELPAGSTWIAFTDQVSHAAMSGQYALEQTFVVPVALMADESKSPLRILERVLGRRLV